MGKQCILLYILNIRCHLKTITKNTDLFYDLDLFSMHFIYFK